MKPNKIFFLHIPKCGGSSIREYFKEIYGEENVHFIHTELNIKPDRKVTLLHNYYDEKFRRDDEYAFSIVRNPINRVYSNFLFFRNKIGGNSEVFDNGRLNLKDNDSFDKFLDMYKFYTNNTIARVFLNEQYNETTSDIDNFKKVKKIIDERFNYIWVLEDVNTMFRKIKKILEIDDVRNELIVENNLDDKKLFFVDNAKDDFLYSPYFIDKINKMNSLDQMIYYYILERFKK